jgi:DNA (cytosine-5)-methyltransferase 1
VKPRLLDAFSGAGGCGRGYQLAGFHVVGVDIKPQPRYAGDEFVQGDALEFIREHGHEFDCIHASPPCHRYSVLRHAAEQKGTNQPDLVDPTREALQATGRPYVIENVPGAPLRHSIVLCGSMFGLGSNGRQLRRHRLFETSFPILQPQCLHEGEAIGVYGGGPTGRYTFGNGAKKDYYNRRGGYQGTVAEKREAMGIDWMNASEINLAIPPAYTLFLGEWLRTHLRHRKAAA